jgi:hypothetical protein
MGMIFRIRKAALEKPRCHENEPKTPRLGRKFADTTSKGTAEIQGNVLGSFGRLLPYFHPYLVRNLVVFSSGIKTLELSALELDQVRDNVFEKKMHAVPWV